MSLAPSFSPPRLLTEQSSWLTDSTGFKHQHIAPYHELHINNNTNNNQHHYHYYHLSPSTDRRRRVELHRQPSAGTTTVVASVHKESEPSVVHKDEESKKMMMKKTVRFCEQDKLEQVRLFLKSQKPSAVRHGDPSPSSYSQTIELKYPNWPPKTVIQSRSTVRMESVQVVTDNDQDTQTTAAAGEICLAGRCRVANLAFEKHVVVRYTTDYWKTYRETEAKYREPIGSSANTWDRFTFSICLNSSNDDGRPITVFLALRYTVNDREFWDNNDGLNYQIDVIPRPSEDDEEDEDENDDKPQFPGNRSKKEPAAMKPFTSTSGARRSMQDYTTQLKGKQQQQSSNKTDIASSLDNNIAPRRKKLSHRYDFGASLSAAKKVSFGKEDETDNVAVTFSVPTTAPARYRHPLLLVDSPSNKQSSHQDQDDDVGFQTRYHEFVNKYCFYGTTNYAPASTTPSLSPCASPEPIYG